MPSYKIIGADLMEYGPVSSEQIRQWIIEGRVDSQTKLQVEGGNDWKLLADVPELAAALPVTTLSRCPTCGKRFEEGFDTCWKCGTGKEIASALLAEAARLESEGDTAGALAKYPAVVQRFQGTEAARDAEASFQSLKAKGS